MASDSGLGVSIDLRASLCSRNSLLRLAWTVGGLALAGGLEELAGQALDGIDGLEEH